MGRQSTVGPLSRDYGITMSTSIVDDHPNIWLIYPHTKCHCCHYALKQKKHDAKFVYVCVLGRRGGLCYILYTSIKIIYLKVIFFAGTNV